MLFLFTTLNIILSLLQVVFGTMIYLYNPQYNNFFFIVLLFNYFVTIFYYLFEVFPFRIYLIIKIYLLLFLFFLEKRMHNTNVIQLLYEYILVSVIVFYLITLGFVNWRNMI